MATTNPQIPICSTTTARRARLAGRGRMVEKWTLTTAATINTTRPHASGADQDGARDSEGGEAIWHMEHPRTFSRTLEVIPSGRAKATWKYYTCC